MIIGHTDNKIGVLLLMISYLSNLVLSSPGGVQFDSCKEVSSYLINAFQPQQRDQSECCIADGNVQASIEVGFDLVSYLCTIHKNLLHLFLLIFLKFYFLTTEYGTGSKYFI